MIASSWLLVAFPALGALVLLVGGHRTNAWGHLLGCATVIASFVYGLALFFSESLSEAADTTVYSWIPVESLQIDFGLRVDPLSVTFVLLITGVGALIHIYSIGYMSNDADRRRFFAYLNLFVAAMLVLVLGNSFVMLYLGWEGVGLASYLLIGWYQDRPAAATAAKKAFLMNRVGDVGLALAIFLMFKHIGSTNYAEVFAGVGDLSPGVITAIALLLLLGACGKSGQFPLQAWLPDAMEGPTPVSALIHAATMVTAGVYLIARSSPIYNLTEDGRLVVTIVGAFTLLLGAIIGCAYDDIKKVLAYSTVSQIGYMMLAVGLGPVGYALGIAHLLTHGFFKAGLFLGAGSVMHGMDDQVDMRRFGGLSRYMKVTWLTFAAGWLAIIGFPGLSGFWSKDLIIEAAFVGEGWRPWVFGSVALVAAGLTAFYMSRLFFMTFHGEKRWAPTREGKEQRPHEAPALMTVPMVILAVGSVGLGAALVVGDTFTGWLEPAIGAVEHHDPVLPVPVIMGATIVLMAAGVFLAWRQYGAAPVPVEAPRGSVLTRAARQDLYQDAVNEGVFMRPGQYLTRALVYGDSAVVDGAVMGLARGTSGMGGWLRRLQTGYIRSYAAIMLVGVVAALVVVLASRG